MGITNAKSTTGATAETRSFAERLRAAAELLEEIVADRALLVKWLKMIAIVCCSRRGTFPAPT